MENKLKEIINKIVREEMYGGKDSGSINNLKKDKKYGQLSTQGKQEAENALKQGNTVNLESVNSVREMARAAEVKYSLKSDFRNDLTNVQSKLSKSEFRSLVDIVKVLKDKRQSLTASDILKFHNEANSDRPYASQQSFIRPLVIGAIGKKKITYDELPFSASQKDVSTGFEKSTGVVTPSQDRGAKFNRDIEYTAAIQANPDYILPAERAALASKTLDYKRAREAYRKADSIQAKQQYVDKMQKMVDNDDELGQEISQQYADGMIQTQDPVTLGLAKKFRITKKKYGIPKISDKETRDAAAVVGGEDNDEEV